MTGALGGSPAFLHLHDIRRSDRQARRARESVVPTLIRLLFVLGLIAALAYGAMVALVTFIHPEQREITQTVRLPGLVK